MQKPPAALVLGVGGILGEVWMTALLAGLEAERGFDARTCERYVGTSAGAIVAAHLVAGESPRDRLGDLPQQPDVEDRSGGAAVTVLGQPLRLATVAAGAAAAPFAGAALRATSAGGALVRRLALSRLAPGRRSLASLRHAIERTPARFDGRLVISAVELDTGRRVTFGLDGAPRASPGQAVEASCAIPGFFRPVEVGGRTYVDGGVWSPTNMDVLRLEPGQRVLCLNPTASLRSPPLAPLVWASRSIAGLEALALRRRRVEVTTVAPDAHAASVIGPNLMDGSRRDAVADAGFAQGAALGRRLG